MSIHIVSSKTDQFRQGDRVLVARTDSPTCPVAMLERYYSLAAIPKQSKLRPIMGNCGYTEWPAAPLPWLSQLHSGERVVFE